LQTIFATVVGIEDNPMLGPRDGGIMVLEPSHTEDDWVVTEARDVELDFFCMRSDLKLNRKSFVSDGAGRDRTPINNLKVSRSGFGFEVDRVGLDKDSVDKRNGSARIDHRKSLNRSARRLDRNWDNNMFFGVERRAW
jgi:hypothetical protein